MRAIKFTRFYGVFQATNPNGERLELCASILNEVVKLPAKCETFYVVPLKRETADTIKLENDKVDGYYLFVDGKRTEFVYETAKFIRAKFFAHGITNFRIEY